MVSRSLVLLLVALCTLSLACAEDADETATSSHPLEGSWNLRASLDHHTCPELGELAPVAPGPVTFARAGDDLLLETPTEAPVAYRAAGPDRLLRQVAGPYEACQVEAEAEWTFDAIDGARFASRYAVDLRVFGEECGQPQEACRASYTVVGARR